MFYNVIPSLYQMAGWIDFLDGYRIITNQKSCEIKCTGGGKRSEHMSPCQDNIATEVVYFFTNEHVSDSHLNVI
jgi:hypothetical protein